MLTKDDKTGENKGDGCLPKDKQVTDADELGEGDTGSNEGETSSDQSEEEFVELMR